jgi:metal-dependent amidase/aminoacylase/carboxypeptidase family protein
LGDENVQVLDARMTAEDFAYYSHYVPSVFYRIGTKIDGVSTHLHSPRFDVNEQALRIAPAVMSYLAIRCLEEEYLMEYVPETNYR